VSTQNLFALQAHRGNVMSSSCLRLAAVRGAFGCVIEVKNTFLDDWADAESAACRRASRRAFRSTPAATAPFELDATASFFTQRGKITFESDLLGPQPRTVLANAVDATVAVVDESYSAPLLRRQISDSCDYRSCNPCAQESRATTQSGVFENAKRCEDANGDQIGFKQDFCDIGVTDEIQSVYWGQIECNVSASRQRDGEIARQGRRCRGSRQLRCCFFLDPCMTVNGFDLNKKVIGKAGCSTKAIYKSTGVKVRLRGIGSGHIEDCGREARVPLMLSLSTARGEREKFRRAIEMAASHLLTIEQRYREFCCKQNRCVPSGRRFWVGETSGNVESLLTGVCDDVFLQPRLLDHNGIDAAEEIKR
jgi:hypothetical protein